MLGQMLRWLRVLPMTVLVTFLVYLLRVLLTLMLHLLRVLPRVLLWGWLKEMLVLLEILRVLPMDMLHGWQMGVWVHRWTSVGICLLLAAFTLVAREWLHAP